MEPEIQWIKNDAKKHQYFTDGSVYLVALQTRCGQEPYKWDFDVVEVDCDGEKMLLYYRGKTEIYDAWDWTDFEYFKVLEGEEPTPYYDKKESEGEK